MTVTSVSFPFRAIPTTQNHGQPTTQTQNFKSVLARTTLFLGKLATLRPLAKWLCKYWPMLSSRQFFKYCNSNNVTCSRLKSIESLVWRASTEITDDQRRMASNLSQLSNANGQLSNGKLLIKTGGRQFPSLCRRRRRQRPASELRLFWEISRQSKNFSEVSAFGN